MKMNDVEKYFDRNRQGMKKFLVSDEALFHLNNGEAGSFAVMLIASQYVFARELSMGRITYFKPDPEIFSAIDNDSAFLLDELELGWSFQSAFIELPLSDSCIGAFVITHSAFYEALDSIEINEEVKSSLKELLSIHELSESKFRDSILFVPMTKECLNTNFRSATSQLMIPKSDWLAINQQLAAVYSFIEASNTGDDLVVDYEPPIRILKPGANKRGQSKLKVVKVGWKLGSAIRSTRSNQSSDVYITQSGRKVSPHFVRGHYRRYRIGPRDNWHYEIKLIMPYWTTGEGKATNVVRKLAI